jgi:broad-specificity NMP kinase
VAVVFVTGMSGVGKSSALAELARRGYRTVDTDYDGWSEHVALADASGSEQLWREDRIEVLLSECAEGALFISGTVSNQVKFYPRFDAIVLLSAPLDVLLQRVTSRDTNDYGKSDDERREIVHYVATIEPLLRAGATVEVDTQRPLVDVVDELEAIANEIDRTKRIDRADIRSRHGSATSVDALPES